MTELMNESLKKHLVESLNKGVRYDGRKLTDYREIELEYGISKSAEGSARVKIGETDVMAGVKLLVGTPYPDTPDEGALMVGAELSPLASPEFESGPPSIESIELARVIDRGVREAKAIDVKKLCIEKGEKAWIVSIDICPINDAGNLLDASGLATIAALQDTLFPKFDGVEINYKEKTNKKLPLSKFPVPVTVYKIGNNFLVDPILEEEKAFDAKLTVTTTDGKLCALQKGGQKPLTTEDINKMLTIGMEKAAGLRKHLKK